MAKTRVSNVEKIDGFWVYFRSTSFMFGLLVLKHNSFPVIAKHSSKKKKKEKKLDIFQKNKQKTTFSTPKKAKSRMSIWQKVSIFESIVDLRALFLACWSWKKN